VDEFKAALIKAKQTDRTTVIYIETDREQRVGGYTWWDVPLAETSTINSVKESFEKLKENKKKQRHHF
jgi:3D-(3,5/4)-trihydroxycyclohexane-1,2-dione acylhydrolase (decyclizing)